MSGAERFDPPEAREISLLGAVNVMLRHRRILFGVPFVMAVGSAIGGLVRGHHYTSRSSFAPQASDDRGSRFVGLAAQFGLNLGRGAATQSVDFYAELLKSQEVLRAAVLTQYRFAATKGSAETVEASLV